VIGDFDFGELMAKNPSAASSLPSSAGHGLETGSNDGMPKRVAIGPLAVDTLSVDELTHKLIAHAFAPGRTNHVITANAQFYVLAEEDEDFRRCVNEAEYVCADGVSVTAACRWLGGTPVSRIAGVDLISSLCEAASSFRLPIYFLGGKPESASKSASILMKRYPGFRLAGVSCPPYGFLEKPEIAQAVMESIRAAQPSIIFVALGAPRQEFFIQEYIRPLGIPVAVGVGGSFEMICGALLRAPMWMRRAGLEWAFRWWQEPLRLANRYVVGNTLFLYYLTRYLLKRSAQTGDSRL